MEAKNGNANPITKHCTRYESHGADVAGTE